MASSYYSSHIRPRSLYSKQASQVFLRPTLTKQPKLIKLLVIAGAVVLLALGAGLVSLSFSDLNQEQQETQRYEKLTESTSEYLGTQNSSKDRTVSVSPYLQQNTEACAWLSIANTSINYPVAQATKQKPEFYLTHNLWGESNLIGCLYIDRRTNKSANHILVFGHRTGLEQSMFSELRLSYEQSEFDMLGNLAWETRSAPYTTTYKPLCAFKTDENNQQIQQFDFDSTSKLQDWLNEIIDSSSTQSQNAKKLIASASRAITLVTCSEERSGQSGRSVVVFVS